MAHNTRGWAAVETTDLIGSEHMLAVTGQFEALRSNEEATLVEAVPQGISPASLILKMNVTSTGASGDVVLWKEVTPFIKPISSHQYADVTIRTDGGDETIKVTSVPS